MLIIGSGGLVLQMLDDLWEQYKSNISFWINRPSGSKIVSNDFEVFFGDESLGEALKKNEMRCIIGVGGPGNRLHLFEHLESFGARPTSFFSEKSIISKFSVLDIGCLVLHASVIEAGVYLGKGCLINTNVIITHECKIGDFVEVGPGAILCGNVSIGNNTFIGAGATILPGIKIGENSIIGAGSVVTKNINDSAIVVGNPAKLIER